MRPDRLVAYLELADRVCRVVESLAAAATEHLAQRTTGRTTRDDVLIGLALKIAGSFRALIADSRAQRSEALHHLKTMVEAYIYFYVVISDSTERTAERVLADAVALQHETRLREVGGDPDEIRDWQEFGDDYRAQADRLGRLPTLAADHSTELKGWYSRIYRLACQSAHLGDLLLWMPDPDDREIRLEPKVAKAQATTAIHNGLYVVLGMLDVINAGNDAGLRAPTEELWSSLKAIEADNEAEEKG